MVVTVQKRNHQMQAGSDQMIYDTLEESLVALDELGTYDPAEIIKAYHIDLNYAPMPTHISGYTFPLTRTLFINERFNGHTSEVHPICHEIMHCLLDSSVEPLLESSYVSNSKIEARANDGAFYIMMKWYLQMSENDSADFDFIRFLDAFKIPPKLTYQAALVAEETIKIHHSNE